MMRPLSELSPAELIRCHITDCPCGRIHEADLAQPAIGPGSVRTLPEHIRRLGMKRPLAFSDRNLAALARSRVLNPSEPLYVLNQAEPSASDATVAEILAAAHGHDGLIAIGSGTLNDIGKAVSARLGLPFILVATAPSMDGFVSATSSLTVDGIKTSVPSRPPDVIIADTDIVRTAPLRLYLAGFGDMLAKITSLLDWRIAHLITGEYYCSEVAALVRRACIAVLETAHEIPDRSPRVTERLLEGLILSGLAMSLAGVSRPASGTEHYISHLWDMRHASLGHAHDLHGLQCLVGTLETLKLMAAVRQLIPQHGRAHAAAAAHDPAIWAAELHELLGPAARPLIELEEKEQKYHPGPHAARLERILAHWPQILEVLDELPDFAELEKALKSCGAPLSVADLKVTEPRLTDVIRHTGDIRDKYIITRLLFDLGELDSVLARLYGPAQPQFSSP
ncbi:MAG: sn-glycerol-1-phosphate dehydrogenase [Bacillota bacterium]|nr:sn-glycerol-1-phosphate dehydrogenase [Bacillota bacterium]